MDRATTLQACRDAVEHYKKIWYLDTIDNHLWQKANQMDSYLRFAAIATKVFGNQPYWYQVLDSSGPSGTMLQDYWDFVSAGLNNTTFWTDDYGWTGIACLTVSEHLMSSPPPTSPPWTAWRDQGIRCFERMVETWDSTTLAKPVQHGISNCPLQGDPSEYAKNTVTNANFMALSMHLYEFLKKYPDPSHPGTAKQCLTYAYHQYAWFYGWINTKADGKDIPYNYFHELINLPSIGLLEERPVAWPPTGTYPVTTNPPFTPHASWSGDQGLFLNACSLLFLYAEDLNTVLGLPPNQVNIVKQNLVTMMRSVLLGVYYALSSYQTDRVLRETPFQNFFSGDPGDYMCGRGVLARFINEEETRRAFSSVQPPVSILNSAFEATAAFIYSGRDKSNNQLSARWNPDKDESAYKVFVDFWRSGNPSYSWPKNSDVNSPVWDNYCMMMGFDVYGAWLRASPWWPLSTDGGKSASEKVEIMSKI